MLQTEIASKISTLNHNKKILSISFTFILYFIHYSTLIRFVSTYAKNLLQYITHIKHIQHLVFFIVVTGQPASRRFTFFLTCRPYHCSYRFLDLIFVFYTPKLPIYVFIAPNKNWRVRGLRTVKMMKGKCFFFAFFLICTKLIDE